MIFNAAAHTLRDTKLLEAAAAQLVSPSSSMIVLVRHTTTDAKGERVPGTLECMHHADLVKPAQRDSVLKRHGIDLDSSPLTCKRYAVATVMDGCIAVLGNSEALKELLRQTLTTYGAVVHELSPREFEIIFTKFDD